MSAQIIRFDDRHPDFADRTDIHPVVGLQIYFGGIYLGGIVTESRIEAFSRDWNPLGVFASIDAAATAILEASLVAQPSN